MQGKAEGKNRRSAERIDAAFTLAYSVEKSCPLRISLGLVDDLDALMINLSDSGVAIITKHELPLGTKLYLKFNVIDLHSTGDDRRRHMEITGEVISDAILSDGSPRISHRIGLRFVNISNEDKIAINNFVKRNKFSTQ